MKLYIALCFLAFASVMFVGNAQAGLINGKPTIHVPSNRLSEARDLLMQNPDAAKALNSGALQIAPDLEQYSAFDYFAGKPVPSRLDYPDPNSPNGFNSVSGQDNIKNKLEELNRLNQKDIPPANNQPPKQQEDYCVFMQGGNVQDSFNPGALPEGVTTTGSATGYGNYDPIDPTKNSQENKIISETGQGTFEDRFNGEIAAAKANIGNNPGQKVKIYLPNAGESVDGALLGEYNVDGVNVKTGTHYTIGKTAPDGITVDENCKPIKGKVPDPGKDNPGGANPGFDGLGGNPGGGNNGGGGNGGGGGFGGLGGGGGLAALLPLLMQMLGQGAQQGQGQNQYGAGYGNQQQNCAAQPVNPVCGSDGRTYNNQCYATQLGAIVRNTGVCVQPSTSPTPTPTPNVNSIVTLSQLSQSGIPTSLLENVRNLVSSVLSSILSGGHINETVVR